MHVERILRRAFSKHDRVEQRDRLTATLNIVDVLSQLDDSSAVSISMNIDHVYSYLDVARNFPSGENCICLTSATCTATSCAILISRSLGTSAAILERLSTDFSEDLPPVASDDIVRFLEGLAIMWKPEGPAVLFIMITERTRCCRRVFAGEDDGPAAYPGASLPASLTTVVPSPSADDDGAPSGIGPSAL